MRDERGQTAGTIGRINKESGGVESHLPNQAGQFVPGDVGEWVIHLNPELDMPSSADPLQHFPFSRMDIGLDLLVEGEMPKHAQGSLAATQLVKQLVQPEVRVPLDGQRRQRERNIFPVPII
jgi:hypothetical protein